DERGSGTHGREEGKTTGELRVDRSFRTGKRSMQPVVRFERIGPFGVLAFGRTTVVYQLAPSAVLVELGGAFMERVGTPEVGADALVLPQDLVLLHQFREQDVERAD